jgi:hypothetical protein
MRRVERLFGGEGFMRGYYKTRDSRFMIFRDQDNWWRIGVQIMCLDDSTNLSPTREDDLALLRAAGLGKYGLGFPTRRQALEALQETAYGS